MITQFEKYLLKHPLYPKLISTPPHSLLNKIITIPVFNEPNFLKVLSSIKDCKAPKFPAEVIILINHSESTSETIKKQNKKTFIETQNWIKQNSSNQLSFHVFLIDNLNEKYAGVGLARKIAMDEAVKRFSKIDQENGIVVSLDADTTVSKNYLFEIENSFLQNPKLNVVLPQFDHCSDLESYSNNTHAILQYELHLRYFKLALKSTGFPYAYHTIGSAFAVSAMAYVKQGGMNKKQGGEDFYFLQKVFQLGNTKELNNITVYPSARASDRVPFGTGPAVRKIIEDGTFFTYNPVFFNYLKDLFSHSQDLYKANKDSIETVYNNLHDSLNEFISLNEFTLRINEINRNSASDKTFVQRFYNWFDAFRIIKYLNKVHLKVGRVPVEEAVDIFLVQQNLHQYESSNPSSILIFLKEIELGNT